MTAEDALEFMLAGHGSCGGNRQLHQSEATIDVIRAWSVFSSSRGSAISAA